MTARFYIEYSDESGARFGDRRKAVRVRPEIAESIVRQLRLLGYPEVEARPADNLVVSL